MNYDLGDNFKSFCDSLSEYRNLHGEHSLKTRVFVIGNVEPADSFGLRRLAEGFPVMVRASNEKEVTLINLQDKTEFNISLQAFEVNCESHHWMPDEADRLFNPAKWERESKMYQHGLTTCGI